MNQILTVNFIVCLEKYDFLQTTSNIGNNFYSMIRALSSRTEGTILKKRFSWIIWGPELAVGVAGER